MLFGFELALVGMGVVFSFLILLVFVTTFMSHLIHRFQGEQNPSDVVANKKNNASIPPVLSDKLLNKIITAAIAQHRMDHHG